MSDLITGDAVVLDLRLAQLPSRAMSISIDITLQLILLAVVSGFLGALGHGLDAAATQAIGLVLVVSVIVGYPVVFETLSRGRTLGKIALGLRVVRDDGGPERFRQALIRALAEVVEIWLTLGVIAVFASLASSRGKRVGDAFAGTVVVRERMPAQGGSMAWTRPELAPWAMNADISRVPDSLALSARSLIARWPGLDPQSRTAMAARLATEIGRYVSPPSPPGTPPEAYLNAVLAERRRRDQARFTTTPVALPTALRMLTARERPDTPPPAEETSTGGFSVPG